VTVFSPIDGNAITMYDPFLGGSTGGSQRRYNDSNLKTSTADSNSISTRTAAWRKAVRGSSTDRSVADVCSSQRRTEFLVVLRSIEERYSLRTQLKLVGTYPLRGWGSRSAVRFRPAWLCSVQHNLPTLQQGSVASPNASLNLPNGAGTVFTVTRRRGTPYVR